MFWEIWSKALGEKAFEDKKKADRVAIIRTFWVILQVVTCIFIIIGNGKMLGLWL